MSQEAGATRTELTDPSSELIVGVRFNPVGKVYHFSAGDHPELREGDLVVVTTSRGQQIGQVAVVGPLESTDIEGRLKPVDRRATGRDLAIRKYWESRELQVLITARELNAEVGLPIKLVKAEYSFDGKQLTFMYSAEERRETKALRQRLSRAFRARIEMRQIGPRDVAKLLGGYGACGGPRCCSTFLTEFSPISIRMAKAQGVSLNPSEITGMCGRLRCCLIYEYEQYVAARKHLPKKGKRVGTTFGEGKVISLFPLKETALIDFGDRRVEVHREDIIPLDEWRALQAKAAEECGHGANCTCGRKETAPSKSKPPKYESQPSEPQKLAPDDQSGAEQREKDSSSRRRRRRRRKK